MSFQRPNMVAGPSSASYSEFLKDIYSSLRNLTSGINLISQRLDNLQKQLQSFDAMLEQQNQMSLNLATRLDTLIQQTKTKEIRQTTTGLSLLSELDTLGSRQVEPSTGLAELGLRTDKLLSTTLLSKLSFQFPEILELPETTTLEQSPPKGILTEQECGEPSTTNTRITTTNSELNTDLAIDKLHLGTNFLILD